MLGSLARKLRAFGFDTTYGGSLDDKDLAAAALREERVLLTADRSLAEWALRRGVRVVLMKGSGDAGRLSAIAATAEESGWALRAGPSRCSICNGNLTEVGSSSLGGRVPPGVLRRHRKFYLCDECGRRYWKGSHWKKLRSLRRRLPTGNDPVHGGRRLRSEPGTEGA